MQIEVFTSLIKIKKPESWIGPPEGQVFCSYYSQTTHSICCKHGTQKSLSMAKSPAPIVRHSGHTATSSGVLEVHTTKASPTEGLSAYYACVWWFTSFTSELPTLRLPRTALPSHTWPFSQGDRVRDPDSAMHPDILPHTLSFGPSGERAVLPSLGPKPVHSCLPLVLFF